MSTETAKTLLGLGASLGVFVSLGWMIVWYWNRIRWRRFEVLVRSWVRDEMLSDDLSGEEWKSLSAMKLSEAGFGPMEVQALLDLAVIVAKGRTSMEVRGRVQFKDNTEGE